MQVYDHIKPSKNTYDRDVLSGVNLSEDPMNLLTQRITQFIYEYTKLVEKYFTDLS